MTEDAVFEKMMQRPQNYLFLTGMEKYNIDISLGILHNCIKIDDMCYHQQQTYYGHHSVSLESFLENNK